MSKRRAGPNVQLRLPDSGLSDFRSILSTRRSTRRLEGTAMEDKTVHLDRIKALIAREEYRVDEHAVADAILERLADARLWLEQKNGGDRARPADV